MNSLLDELDLPDLTITRIDLNIDNNLAMKLAKDPEFYTATI